MYHGRFTPYRLYSRQAQALLRTRKYDEELPKKKSHAGTDLGQGYMCYGQMITLYDMNANVRRSYLYLTTLRCLMRRCLINSGVCNVAYRDIDMVSAGNLR